MRKLSTPEGKIDRLEYQEAQLTIEFNRLKHINRQLLFDSLFFRKRDFCKESQDKVSYR